MNMNPALDLLAQAIEALKAAPNSREMALALTSAEQAEMWARRAFAEPPKPIRAPEPVNVQLYHRSHDQQTIVEARFASGRIHSVEASKFTGEPFGMTPPDAREACIGYLRERERRALAEDAKV